MNLPDPKQRVRHVSAAFAVLILGLLCLTFSWRWAFFLIIPLWLMEPTLRGHFKTGQTHRIIALFAILMLALVCLTQKWLWVFFLAALLNLAEPDWRAQMFQPAGSLAGFFILASLLIFTVPLAYLYWTFACGKAFDPASPSVITEGIFLVTITMGGFLLHRRMKPIPVSSGSQKF